MEIDSDSPWVLEDSRLDVTWLKARAEPYLSGCGRMRRVCGIVLRPVTLSKGWGEGNCYEGGRDDGDLQPRNGRWAYGVASRYDDPGTLPCQWRNGIPFSTVIHCGHRKDGRSKDSPAESPTIIPIIQPPSGSGAPVVALALLTPFILHPPSSTTPSSSQQLHPHVPSPGWKLSPSETSLLTSGSSLPPMTSSLGLSLQHHPPLLVITHTLGPCLPMPALFPSSCTVCPEHLNHGPPTPACNGA
ncbi:hypothetical protein LIA77_01576 [Sarocladium implicatum]|nr:hypothetical protein LIA77_01576 [Sarocladium implicatum]